MGVQGLCRDYKESIKSYIMAAGIKSLKLEGFYLENRAYMGMSSRFRA